jgi:hypothetical protein
MLAVGVREVIAQAAGFSVTAGTTYTVTVGAGGPAGAGPANEPGTVGFNSVFDTITSAGGGKGGGGLTVGPSTTVGGDGGEQVD